MPLNNQPLTNRSSNTQGPPSINDPHARRAVRKALQTRICYEPASTGVGANDNRPCGCAHPAVPVRQARRGRHGRCVRVGRGEVVRKEGEGEDADQGCEWEREGWRVITP